ncbi:hypothetical protein RFI_37232, partial [Reticulomyxa filosa]
YKEEELGHLKIKTSHLWIKHSSSKIDCSQLGYPANRGPGKGNWSGIGSGYGTKGEGNDGKSGEMYGEETFGGGIIELIIEQQLINHGLIQSNGGNGYDGGGSGGSILIELQCQSQSQSNKLEQTFGTITCIGGDARYRGGDGRI